MRNLKVNEDPRQPEALFPNVDFCEGSQDVPAEMERILDKLDAVAELLRAHDGPVPKETAAAVGTIVADAAGDLRIECMQTLEYALKRLGRTCGFFPQKPAEEVAESAEVCCGGVR